MGKSRAKDLILTGRKLDAAEDLHKGLVNRCVPRAEMSKHAADLPAEIASNGPVAVRAAKQAIDRGGDAPMPRGLEIEAECYGLVLPTQDRLEALAAFAEKRRPEFQGR